MQHDVLASVLQTLARVDVGRSSPALAGLRVTPLVTPDPPLAEVETAVTSNVRWAETVPPHPGRVRARNAAPVAVVVPAGTVLAGGMSARTVRAAATVAARGVADVAVVPLGARWWDEGRLSWGGRLSPVGAALLLHAVLGEGAVAASARTALSSLSLRVLVPSPDDPGLDPAAPGWVLSDGGGAVAAWLAQRRGPPERAPSAHARSAPGAAGAAPGVLGSLRNGLRRGLLVAHLLERDPARRDVAVLPRDLRLVDRLVAATTGAAAGGRSTVSVA